MYGLDCVSKRLSRCQMNVGGPANQKINMNRRTVQTKKTLGRFWHVSNALQFQNIELTSCGNTT